MNISLNWLKTFVQLDVNIETLAHEMTMLGLEIEAIEKPGAEIANVFVGKILSIDPHPDAEKLVVCKTDVGEKEPLTIVCGAKNMKPGDKVPTAIIGATLPGGFAIARRKMRGIESQGMMCSADELGLGGDHSGLLILEDSLEIGKDIKSLLGLDDAIFEIEVIPNRGDWASMIGVAREVAALHKKPFNIPEITLNESEIPAKSLSSVTIEAPDLCPRYIGRVLTNVTVAPSPTWLANRLIAAGQRPINNIVDITNYVLLETGHPLHAFDYDKLAENRIVVRRAKPGELMNTLDGEQRTLSDTMLVIADAKSPQAVAGVMGGADSEVSETTTRIFLESAYFKPSSIRATARALGMMTEASQHFQRGADPEMAVYAINRAAMLMQQLGGAEIAQGLLDEYPNPLPRKEVALNYAKCNQFLNTKIDGAIQRDYLVSLGFEVIAETAQACTLRVPTWRHDVSMGADLYEEVARLYGYNNIASTLPKIRQNVDGQVFAPEWGALRKLRDLVIGLGLTEIYNWTFSTPEDTRNAGLPESYQTMVMLANPLSEKQSAMQTSLIPGLINTAAYNVNRGRRDMALFEIAPIYRTSPEGELPTQSWRLGVLLSGAADALHWKAVPRPVDFFDLKGIAESVLQHYRISPVFTASEFGPMQPGQAAQVTVGEDVVLQLGKVAATVRKAFDIEHDLYIAEFDLDALMGVKAPYPQFQPVPTFPPSSRDLAVLVDAATPADALLTAARQSGGKLLSDIAIFDVYQGEQVPAGKKSVALTMTFQSEERTLTDTDTQKAVDKVLRRLEHDFGAQRR